jgi:hypothetical protein
MAVSAINITIEQGADFTATYNIKDPDESSASLVNYTAIGTLKKHSGAATGYQFVSLLDTNTAILDISLSRTVTASLNPGRYYYDLFLISPSGIRTKIIEGNALVNGSATLPT